jgi:hypothetical protein
MENRDSDICMIMITVALFTTNSSKKSVPPTIEWINKI